MALDKNNPVDRKEFAAMGQVSTSLATATQAGTVKKAASQPPAAGANPTKAEYDALLTALRNAGLMV